MSTLPITNRRRFERFMLPAAYTAIAIRTLDSDTFDFEGHTYDISEGGLQFELDRGFEAGTQVAIKIELPDAVLAAGDTGPGRAVFAFGNIVWMDDSEPGPVRMAVVFTRFARTGDRERLLRTFAAGRLRRAA
ncbi:hypothetical protein LBMAG48_18100 [Phycisphaerae bacterium]|jgi:c-di-GMP-binding flagellar brake protein YcgR|nr:hypothetical protein LBMAG48_18100 [Phycisphaerae bacterium]